jgi:hypothetical protein
VSIRFLADADLNYAIVSGARLLEPGIDFKSSFESGLKGIRDPEVLRLAANQGRILVSHDKKTLPRHFARFLAEQVHSQVHSPGVLLVAQKAPVREVIDALVLIWCASDSAEWADQIHHLPSLEEHALKR